MQGLLSRVGHVGHGPPITGPYFTVILCAVFAVDGVLSMLTERFATAYAMTKFAAVCPTGMKQDLDYAFASF